MKILVTGAEGFIGRNLCLRLEELGRHDIIKIDRSSTESELKAAVTSADFIYHLAGVNRPISDEEFGAGNHLLTQRIVDILKECNLQTPIMLSSSIQATFNNSYGLSKAAAEDAVLNYANSNQAQHYIYRFPNVFGKWCRPNYNSFVATFCNNIASGLNVVINDTNAPVTLVYIDDVCSELIDLIDGKESGYRTISIQYQTTVGEVANILHSFKDSRDNLTTPQVGTGLVRALYSTYLSYLKPEQFGYSIPSYSDQRGTFCEMLKTKDSGQFSFFTAHPGITRGGHYHHSKNEKFLVIQGDATFKFEHVVTGERYELKVSSGEHKVVETVPGWTHDITNTGTNELIVMLWANEIFDKNAPDTIARSLA
ncbi:NAD-dependent epimerase/dehydratase family protein [Enterobacter sp. CC120223-11]|uniref:UDP-2-acetamido-2,6-beta-L-arabino-hexul-4-ose reductase n=1 Tax=Enterobacter sp. CC120223-11 TaxID=1378073 RepID=UPI000BC5E440|nr:NAD-dependent epimerase/dehydratase family protein [Enterobacter sp. CC120223-11]SNY64187.1 UDP-2-acetamido-2,6-beta-L-arabino-hexul-4-ose reductase [Enterobacter sp. CC120223-11]